MICGTTDVAIKEKSKRRSDEMQRIENIEKCQTTSKSTLNENYRKEKMKSMLKNKAEQGITLVALVITVIIIIILATVAINFAFGNNGLITRAEQARDFYANDTKYTEESMSNVESYLEGMLPGGSEDGGDEPETPPEKSEVAEAIENNTQFTDTTTIKDDLDNPVTIPGGFHLAEDSGTKVEEGIVIEDNTENHNQFVWIPVGEYNVTQTIEAITESDSQDGKLINELTRRQWGTTKDVEQIPTPITDDEVADGYDGEIYYGEGATQDKDGNPISPVETNIEAFKTSATTKGGFYIGRYEQGTGNVCKAGVDAYVSVIRDTAKTKAEAMYNGKEEIKATTELISSYAWDTALNFICQTNADGYELATTTDETKANIGTSNKTQTGKYEADKYSNIHDFLGNVREWTTEYSSNSSRIGPCPCVFRGGHCNGVDYPAGRVDYLTTNFDYTLGFRVQLYV